MCYAIGEFSVLTNLSIHTLRYYEKEKLIAPERKENGRRCYSEQDVAWIQFIKRLKDTGMPIKEIQNYAALRAAGDSTRIERMELLTRHRTVLHEEITKLQEHCENLDHKIALYRTQIGRMISCQKNDESVQ